MKTQNRKLQFGKSSITELNDSESMGINGGCQWSQSSGQTVSIIKSIIGIPPQEDNDFIVM